MLYPQPKTTIEFTRMILREWSTGDAPSTFHPSASQLTFVDNLGIQPVEWESGISLRNFSRMIDDEKLFCANFQEQVKQRPATGNHHTSQLLQITKIIPQ